MRISKLVSMIIWLLVAAILIGVLAVGLAFDFAQFSLGFFSFRYDNAQDYKIGGTTVSDTVNELDIDWPYGYVNIEVYDGDVISFSEDLEPSGDMQLRWVYNNGELSIKYCKSKFYWGFVKYPKKTLTVKIPNGAVDDLRTVEAESVSAEFSVNGIAVDKLSLETVSGGVDIDGAMADVIDISAVSAVLDLEGTFGSINIETVSGDCDITDSVMPAEIDFEAVSADVDLTIADGDGFAATFDKVSGEFYSEYPTGFADDRYVYADGLAIYSFETVSGNVNIRKLVKE